MTTIPYGKLQHCPTETDEAVTKWQIPQTKGHDLANVIIKSFYVYLIQSWPFLSPWAAATSRSHNPRHPLPARLFLTDPFRNSQGYLNRSGRVLKSAFSGFLFRLPLILSFPPRSLVFNPCVLLSLSDRCGDCSNSPLSPRSNRHSQGRIDSLAAAIRWDIAWLERLFPWFILPLSARLCRQLFRWFERSDSSDLPWRGSLAMDYGPTDSSGELH